MRRAALPARRSPIPRVARGRESWGKRRLAAAAWGLLWMAAAGVSPADNPFATAPVDGKIPALPGGTLALPSAPLQLTGGVARARGLHHLERRPRLAGNPEPHDLEGPLRPGRREPLRFTASPVFPVRVELEWSAAKGHLTALDPATIGDVFHLFETLGEYQPGATATVAAPKTPTSFFFGYRPVRARWLRAGGGLPPARISCSRRSTTPTRTTPRSTTCASGRRGSTAPPAAPRWSRGPAHLARRARRLPRDVLGQAIDFLVVLEPTLALDGPQRFTGAAGDLTRAFTVPFLFGTRVTPIRGLGLPGFGEIRAPLELVSGDTEATTVAEKRPVFTGWAVQCPPCRVVPKLPTFHTKDYQTVTHVDAISSVVFAGDNALHVDAEFTLFTLGPVRIFGTLALGFEVGAFETRDDRVLAGFPSPPAREGFLLENPLGGVRYHDGPWLVARRPYLHWQVQPEGATDPFWTRPILPILGTADIRAVTNDDHLAETSTALGSEPRPRRPAGRQVGALRVILTVHGKVTGDVAQRFVLRDALMAQDPLEPGFLPRMRPITAVSIRPRQTADVTFDGLTATLKFLLDLGSSARSSSPRPSSASPRSRSRTTTPTAPSPKPTRHSPSAWARGRPPASRARSPACSPTCRSGRTSRASTRASTPVSPKRRRCPRSRRRARPSWTTALRPRPRVPLRARVPDPGRPRAPVHARHLRDDRVLGRRRRAPDEGAGGVRRRLPPLPVLAGLEGASVAGQPRDQPGWR